MRSPTVPGLYRVAPAATAASRRMVSSTCRRGATSRSTPAVGFTAREVNPLTVPNPTVRTAGAPLSSTWSSNPHRDSCTTPERAIACVDKVSCGIGLRSTKATS